MQSHSEGNPPQLWSFIPPRTRDTDLEAVRLSFRGRKKPVRRATQRDEEAIALWKGEKLPEIKKRPVTKIAP